MSHNDMIFDQARDDSNPRCRPMIYTEMELTLNCIVTYWSCLFWTKSYEALNNVPHEVDCNAVFSLNNRNLDFTGWVNHDRYRRFLNRKDAIADRNEREQFAQPKTCNNCGLACFGYTFHGLSGEYFMCRDCQVELEIGED